MSKGNVHKMHNGYKRHQERVPASTIIFHAQVTEAERIHEECLDEMELDEMFDDDFNDCDFGNEPHDPDFNFGYSCFDDFDLEPFNDASMNIAHC